MKIEKELEIARVEVVRKTYDKQSRVVVEEIEYYFPSETNKPIGFKCSTKRGKR